jgi:hypothetical protein
MITMHIMLREAVRRAKGSSIQRRRFVTKGDIIIFWSEHIINCTKADTIVLTILYLPL